MRRWIAAIALLAAACGGEASTTDIARSDAGSTPSPDAGTITPGADAGSVPADDPSERLFPADRLVEVQIDLAPADWDALRNQTRFAIEDLVGAMCLADPFESPYTWFRGDVTVDGRTIRGAGISKKGFVGSLSTERPSLKIKLDEFVPDQAVDGLSRLTLNNAQQDPAVIRQCLGYSVFRKAGLPAPRCAFAHVTVNGVDAGPYVHVETVRKPFLRRHFARADGALYEGSLSDFRRDWLGTFELQSGDEAPAALAAVAEAVEAPDPEAALARVLDLDRYYRFWAVESLIGHWDGYDGNSNNFFAYLDPASGRFSLLPWGADGILGQEPPRTAGAPVSVYATSAIPHRLYALPGPRARFAAEMRDVLARAWDAPGLLADSERHERLITPIVPAAYRPGWSQALLSMRLWITGRASDVVRELDAGLRDWPAPLRPAPCLRDLGRLTATFSTTWGTHPAPNPFNTGTGTLTGTVAGVAVRDLATGAAVGMGVNPGDMGLAVLIVPAVLPDQTVAAVYVSTRPAAVRAGEVPLDQVDARGALYLIRTPGGAPEQVGFFVSGRVVFEQAAPAPGAPVRGRVEARVVAGF